MATRDYKWVGYNRSHLNNQLPGGNTVMPGDIQFGALPMLNDLNARRTVTYDAASVTVVDLDEYWANLGWTPA